MLVISDVHGAISALARVVGSGDTVLILGDLANLTDYRTGEGAIASALGIDFAKRAAAVRGHGDFDEMRRLWRAEAADDAEMIRANLGRAVEAQYVDVSNALAGGSGFVIHGNVDRPEALVAALPPGFKYVHGERVIIDGVVFGFVGGGVSTPLRATGEVSDAEMEGILGEMGPVDVLCSHVAPALTPLSFDVVTGRRERSSEPVLTYLRRHPPRLHLFGDIHQPKATTWRLGPTRCVNVGYFRATGRPYQLDLSRF